MSVKSIIFYRRLISCCNFIRINQILTIAALSKLAILSRIDRSRLFRGRKKICVRARLMSKVISKKKQVNEIQAAQYYDSMPFYEFST